MRILNNNRGYALIIAVFIAIFLGIFLSAAFTSSDLQMKAAEERSAAQLAFYAAEAGLENSVFELRRNDTWLPPSPAVWIPVNSISGAAPVAAGDYALQVRIAPPDPTYPSFPAVWVRSDGRDPNRQITRALLAKVILFNPAQFFVSSLADIRIGSGATYSGDLLGRDIHFEINPALPPPGNNIIIDGDVYYFRNVYGAGSPYVQFLGNPPQPFTSITFPGVDTARYRDLAQAGGKYVSGDYMAPINITRGNVFASPATANGVVFAEGDIHIQGTYNDSLVFVAGGDIYINGDLTPVPSGGSSPQVGLFSKHDIIIPASSPSDMSVEGFLIADGAGSSYGELKALGDKYSKGTFNFEGAMAVRGLESDGTSPRTAFNLNVFANRNYTYDPNLRASCTIPFMSFVANIISWEEINPNDTVPIPRP